MSESANIYAFANDCDDKCYTNCVKSCDDNYCKYHNESVFLRCKCYVHFSKEIKIHPNNNNLFTITT